MGQPFYQSAALVWSLHLNIVRMCRRRPANADWSADASKKPVVVRRFGHANPFWAFKARAAKARARVVPNTHHGRVAAGAATADFVRKIKN